MQMKRTDFRFTDADYLLYAHTIYNNPYIHFELYPLQEDIAMLSCQNFSGVNRLLTGGSGGGGKTMLLSALALQFMTYPNYRCLVTRKGYRELIGSGSVFDIIKRVEGLNVRESSPIKITSPCGAEIHFKAFADERHKQDVKGESYHTILNDEASELDESVLRFLNRSVRKSTDDPIPLRVVNASNPSATSTTEYLRDKYVDGELPYVEMGYKDNPYIDTRTYEEALMELDYIDRQYQMKGNWHYKVQVGDLINRDEMEAQLVTNLQTPLQLQLIGIDLAGKGKDKFAICCYELLANGWEYIRDFAQTQSSYVEDLLLRFVMKYNKPNEYPTTSAVVIEQEGGGSPVYAQRYFQELLQEFGIPVMLKHPSGSKFQRARPLLHSIKMGNTKLNKESTDMDEFIDESVGLNPIKNDKSPNLVDSASLVRNYLHEEIIGKQTRFTTGKRIGG